MQEFIQWIREQPCCITASDPPSDPCHVRTWAASRQHWNNVVPMNRRLHNQQHVAGNRKFQQDLAVNLSEMAEKYTKLFVMFMGFNSLEEMLEDYDVRYPQ